MFSDTVDVVDDVMVMNMIMMRAEVATRANQNRYIISVSIQFFRDWLMTMLMVMNMIMMFKDNFDEEWGRSNQSQPK